MAAARRFPSKRKIEVAVVNMIRDGQIIFPYQEAECLRAVRYLSTLHSETIEHCWSRLVDVTADRYLRMQAAYLLSRTSLGVDRLFALRERFESEADSYVQVAMSTLLTQSRGTLSKSCGR